MAGSFEHCLTDDKTYRGADLLENMGDMREAVEHMVFMLLYAQNSLWGGERLIQQASDAYYESLRGERPWPPYMLPGIQPT
jgi:hypothetical protein